MDKNTRLSEIQHMVYGPDAFSRIDEGDDAVFYETDRMVNHLDYVACRVISNIIGQLVTEESPVLLDLMASWNSHLPTQLRPSRVVGLGLNRRELGTNRALTEVVMQDLNKDPRLPFASDSFDVVLNTVSVDYLTRPFEVFREAGRILKPGGLFLVLFSNRMFPTKAVRVWKDAGEDERMMIVEDYFEQAACFGDIRRFVYKGRPRPSWDKYAPLGIPSDPVYAVYADKQGADGSRARRAAVKNDWEPPLREDDIEARKRLTRETLRCPYCEAHLKKWMVPVTPFSEWDTEFLYICFNDSCPYLVRGWDTMAQQRNMGASYRLSYVRERNVFEPLPVPHLGALKDGIVEESG